MKLPVDNETIFVSQFFFQAGYWFHHPFARGKCKEMIYFFFLIKLDHVLILNKSMEEKNSSRLSLFTVTESPYLTLLKPFLPTLLNQAKSVVESFQAEFFAMFSPFWRRS